MSTLRGGLFTISASSTKSASGNSGVLQFPSGPIDACQFILNVTAANTPTSLDVYLQHSIDGGSTWWDFGHFAQITSAPSKAALTWSRRTAPTIAASQAVVATGDGALAAGVVINAPIMDSEFRAKWVIVGTSFTFSLIGVYDKD